MDKQEKLAAHLRDIGRGGVLLALSGGVDSALLLDMWAQAAEAEGFPLQAATFISPLQPEADASAARELAEKYGVPHRIVRVDLLADPVLRKNPPDRCYRCKKTLFETLRLLADEANLGRIADGTNADDLGQYRPGLRALRELNIASPLAEMGITKAEVRALAESRGVPAARRPSSPCLATRLPYGDELTAGILRQIDAAERFLKSAGFDVVRLRRHGNIARIEIPEKDFDRFLEQRARITAELKRQGFSYVTLDMEGFRSGSMDISENIPGTAAV